MVVGLYINRNLITPNTSVAQTTQLQKTPQNDFSALASGSDFNGEN
jgi:hypothetical protein